MERVSIKKDMELKVRIHAPHIKKVIWSKKYIKKVIIVNVRFHLR